MSRIRYALGAAILVSALWAQDSVPPAHDGSDQQVTPASSAISSRPSSDLILEVPKKVDAVYPAEAVRDKIQGQVMIRVSIANTGEVESADIVSGNPVLAASALTAARGWIFKTWKYKKYIPLTAWANIAFDFQLPDGQGSGASTKHLAASGKVVESGELQKALVVGPGVAASMLIHRVQPLYPPEAHRARVQGSVVLAAVISKEGTIKDLRVLSGDSMLVDAATDAVRQWRYRPYVLAAGPVEVQTTITLIFTLSPR